MAKITVDIEEFGDLVPFFLGLFIENPDMLSDDADDFYSKISKKIKTDLRQFIRSVPASRRTFKLIKSVFAGGTGNAVITIKPDGQNAITTEQKYLTERYMAPAEIAKKYL